MKKEIYCKKKKGEILRIVISQEKYDDNIYIIPFNASNEKVGFLRYQKIIGDGSKRAWLNIIETTEKYRGRGIGKTLLIIFENEVVESGIHFVEGRFYPSCNYARKFYEDNQYDINYEGYEQYIDKYLDYDKIKEEYNKCIIENVME